MKGWIGVDLDGTLAVYDHWRGIEHIGEPIMPMVTRVKGWLAEGKDVRIFTARVDGGNVALSMGDPNGEAHRDVGAVTMHIMEWCKKHIGRVLPVTCKKDYGMIELWDDRAVQVIPNTGKTLADELAAVQSAHAGKAAVPPADEPFNRRSPDFGKNSVVFAWIPQAKNDARPVLLLGLTTEAWEYMKSGRTHEFDLRRIHPEALDLKISLFSGATKEHLKGILTGEITDNGLQTIDISGRDVGWDSKDD